MLRALVTSLRTAASSNLVRRSAVRSFSTSHSLCLKEIRAREEGDTLIIEGVPSRSGREEKLVKSENKHGACPLCALDLDVKHTDILILKQFMDHNAVLYPRKITGLCRSQHRKMTYLIEMAKRAGLINPLIADQPIPAYQRGWRRYNSYYDETEIKPSKSELGLLKAREFEEAYRIAKAEKDAHEEMLRKRRQERGLQLS